MNSNKELMQRRSQAIPRGVGQIHPIFADRAENCRVSVSYTHLRAHETE